MSKQTNEAKRPTHAIFQVLGEGDKSRWIRIGAAWLHKDEKGLNLVFDAVPVSGRTVIREVSDQAEEACGNGGQQ